MNRKVKRLVLALLAVTILLSEAGCGGASSSREEAAPPAEITSDTAEAGEEAAAVETDSTFPRNHITKGDKDESGTLPASSAPIDSEQAKAALDLLRECMENAPQIALAAAYLGYREADDPTPLTDWLWLNSPSLMEEMPFIQTIPEDRILGTGYGNLYCLVPRDDNTTLAVNHVTWKSTGNGVWPEADEVLYRDEYAQPVLVFVGYDFVDENDKRWSDIQISAVAGNGAEVVWYPNCYPESFIINAPIDEDYNPLILNLDNLTANAQDNWENGDDNWAAPTEMELANTYWYGSGEWYMMLWLDEYSDLYYDKRVDIFQTGGAQYSGVWEMDGECLYLQVVDRVGNVTEGRYPVTISPSGKDLYICEDPKNGVRPVFFGEEDKAVMYLTLVDN